MPLICDRQAAFVAYSTVAILTATTYVLGGLMREQVCIYMCPWPRIQGAMLDDNSLVVTYNDWRGEPRGKTSKKAVTEERTVGDCVDCNACRRLSHGIDIRNGQQFECITCALCIDACDNVMDKLGRERGLIAYATLNEYQSNMALATDAGRSSIDPNRVRNKDGSFVDQVRHFDWKILLRLRTLLYMGVWSAVGLALIVALLSRDRLELNVLHDRNPQYVLESDGSIRNGYTIRLLNMIPERRTVFLSLQGLPGAEMKIPEISMDYADRVFAIPLDPDKATPLKSSSHCPRRRLATHAKASNFVLEDRASGETDIYHANFTAPEQANDGT